MFNQAVVRAKIGHAMALGSFVSGEDPEDSSALMTRLLRLALPEGERKRESVRVCERERECVCVCERERSYPHDPLAPPRAS